MPTTPQPSLILAVALLVAALPAKAAPSGLLELDTKIPLGEVRGRIDHLAIDLARQRLFVAELGNGSLGIVDLARGAVLKRIGGLAEPQGVAYFPATDMIYVASGGDGSLRRFKGDDLAPLGVTELGDDADNVRVDARNGRIVVGYGDGALALIEPGSGDVIGKIPLEGHPELFQLEAGGSRVFVNVPTARQVAVVDRDAGRQVASWKLSGRGNVLKGLFEGQGNFPMALDEEHGRLLVVDRNPPELLVFDTTQGELVARLRPAATPTTCSSMRSATAPMLAAARDSWPSSNGMATATTKWPGSRRLPAPAPPCSCRSWTACFSRSGQATTMKRPSGSTNLRPRNDRR